MAPPSVLGVWSIAQYYGCNLLLLLLEQKCLVLASAGTCCYVCTVYGRILTFSCLSHCISPDQTQLQKLSRVDNPEIKVDGWRGEEDGEEEDEEEEEEEEGEEDLMGEEQRVPDSSSTALPPIEEGSIFSQTSSELFKPSRSVGKNLTIQTIHIKQLYIYCIPLAG